MLNFLLVFIILNTVKSAEIAVLSLAIGDKYQAAVASCIDNKKRYCQKHGYDFIYLEEPLDPDRHPAWQKILLCQKALSTNKYKWVFWSDADSLFMNFAIKLEELIDENYNFIVCEEGDFVNTGQFFIKNCRWSSSFLRAVYAQKEFINDHGWWEQRAVVKLLEKTSRFKLPTKIVPNRLFNSFRSGWGDSLKRTYQKGDFILHFICIRDLDQLNEEIKKHVNHVIDSKEDFSLDYYLGIYDYKLSPKNSETHKGYITDSQKEHLYNKFLVSLPNVTNILEVGFNAGHAAEFFLQSFPNASLTSISTTRYPYTSIGVEYFFRKYKNNFLFLKGTSEDILTQLRGQKTFDLFYLDGNSSFELILNDICNCQHLSNPGAYVILNNYHTKEVKDAVNKAIEKGIITVFENSLLHDLHEEKSCIIGYYK